MLFKFRKPRFCFFIIMFKYMVVTNIKLNDCRLHHSGIYISKKERRRKLFWFNLVTTVDRTAADAICWYRIPSCFCLLSFRVVSMYILFKVRICDYIKQIYLALSRKHATSPLIYFAGVEKLNIVIEFPCLLVRFYTRVAIRFKYKLNLLLIIDNLNHLIDNSF